MISILTFCLHSPATLAPLRCNTHTHVYLRTEAERRCVYTPGKTALQEVMASWIPRDMPVCMYETKSATKTCTFWKITWSLGHVRLRSTKMFLFKNILGPGGAMIWCAFRRAFFMNRVDLFNLSQLPPVFPSKVRTTLRRRRKTTWILYPKSMRTPPETLWMEYTIRVKVSKIRIFYEASFAIITSPLSRDTEPFCPKSGSNRPL